MKFIKFSLLPILTMSGECANNNLSQDLPPLIGQLIDNGEITRFGTTTIIFAPGARDNFIGTIVNENPDDDLDPNDQNPQ
ncbi:MAG: hypothetical protein LBJ89_01155 [Holosporales bacterium]|jgi:hypothetical protein|nr:hypothetical protein [Holosporales bacterium]